MRKFMYVLAGLVLGLLLAGTFAYGSAVFARNAPLGDGPVAAPAFHGENTATPPAAWLGIAGVNNNATLAGHLGSSVSDGVVVMKVAGEQAKAAGLLRGDIITQVDGTAVGNLDALRTLLAQKTAGSTVTVTYIRQGATQTTQVTLQDRPQPAQGPKLAPHLLRLLGGLPLDRLVSSSITVERAEGGALTIQALGGTVTAVQPKTDSFAGSLTIQPKDGSAAQTITLGETVHLLKGLRPIDLSSVQVNDKVVLLRVLEDNVLTNTVVLVGSITFGPMGSAKPHAGMNRPTAPYQGMPRHDIPRHNMKELRGMMTPEQMAPSMHGLREAMPAASGAGIGL